MDISAIALAGLQEANTNLQNTATRIANFNTSSPDGVAPDTVDLTAEMVSMLTATDQFQVNIATMKATDEVQQSVIDLLA